MNAETIEAVAIAIYDEFRSNKVLPAWSNLPDHRREVWRRAARAGLTELIGRGWRRLAIARAA